jgi:hypothetical protein
MSDAINLPSNLGPFYVVLLHHPIVNRRGEEVTTAVTNMDIHDISRSARTFGAKGYFLVTPLEVQHDLVGRILKHWNTPRSKEYHPDRVEALDLAELAHSFQDVKDRIKSRHGANPIVVLTDASVREGVPSPLSYGDFKVQMGEIWAKNPNQPIALVFGTGWGISPSFYGEINRVLAPIYGPLGPNHPEAYNHLSVRSAVAIILDRLFGK